MKNENKPQKIEKETKQKVIKVFSCSKLFFLLKNSMQNVTQNNKRIEFFFHENNKNRIFKNKIIKQNMNVKRNIFHLICIIAKTKIAHFV